MTNRLTDGFRGASMFLTSDQARIYNRLAQYEDTDRTPEEIEQLIAVINLLESDRDAERKMRINAESEAEEWRRKAEAAERDLNAVLQLEELCPIQCEWCKWNDCCDGEKTPEWRGQEVEKSGTT